MKKYAKNIVTPQPEESCPGHPGLIELLKPYIFMDKTLYPDSIPSVSSSHINRCSVFKAS